MQQRKTPLLAVDIVIKTKDDRIVFIKRLNPPFKGFFALPGGFVEYGEKVEEAAIREAKEETGLDVEDLRLIGVYSDPNRDPRGHVVSIAFLAKEKGGVLKASSDAKEVTALKEPPEKLAFDHELILRDAKKMLEEKR